MHDLAYKSSSKPDVRYLKIQQICGNFNSWINDTILNNSILKLVFSEYFS